MNMIWPQDMIGSRYMIWYDKMMSYDNVDLRENQGLDYAMIKPM